MPPNECEGAILKRRTGYGDSTVYQRKKKRKKVY